MNELIFHHVFAASVLLTRSSYVSLSEEVAILVMSDEDPNSDVEFPVIYKRWSFYIFLNYELVGNQGNRLLRRLSDIVVPVEFFRLTLHLKSPGLLIAKIFDLKLFRRGFVAKLGLGGVSRALGLRNK